MGVDALPIVAMTDKVAIAILQCMVDGRTIGPWAEMRFIEHFPPVVTPKKRCAAQGSHGEALVTAFVGP